MNQNYGDCYYCGGEVKEKKINLDFRWKEKLYVLENVPAGVCNQCGEKYFTAEVSEEIDRLVKFAEAKKHITVPVLEFGLVQTK